MKKAFLFLAVLVFQLSLSAQSEAPNNIPSDTLLKNRLEEIRMKDQSLRLLLPEVSKKFGQNSDEHAYFWTLIHREDRANELAITKIIDENGWLGTNRVGEAANQALWLVVQHAPVEMQEKYLPYLQESVEKNESDGWYLAFLEDRILMYNGKKQKFGSQAKYDAEGQPYIYPIEDVKHVNERREKLGLEPIEEYAKKNGYRFDPKY